MSSLLGGLFTKLPCTTFHPFLGFPSARTRQPLRSLPLNNLMGSPHSGTEARSREGARTPVHCKVFPSSPTVVPSSFSVERLPLKTRSSARCSYCFGKENSSWPSLIKML